MFRLVALTAEMKIRREGERERSEKDVMAHGLRRIDEFFTLLCSSVVVSLASCIMFLDFSNACEQ
jgi:hypothetical protein